MSGKFEISSMEERESEVVAKLWRAAGLTRPHNDPTRDIQFARSQPASEILVGRLDGAVVASVMVGHDGHRGVVYYLSVHPDFQGRGFGRKILAAAESWLVARGVWKLNLMIREDNVEVREFYGRAGYEIEPRTVMARWLDPSKRGP